MKFVFASLLVVLAASVFTAEALDRIDGTTKCQTGPFEMEERDCQCASDNMHFTCPAIPRDPPAKPAEAIEGTTKCVAGSFKIQRRQCHCASDYQHFTCPES